MGVRTWPYPQGLQDAERWLAGGKPSKGTKADKRLKKNKGTGTGTKKPTSTKVSK